MPKTTLSGRHGTLEVHREVIPVHYLSDIDAGWTFTDAAGHPHRCEYDAPDHYPTLVLITDRTYWCEDCHDEHEGSHLECRQCGEHVTPGMTGPGVKYIQGLTTYALDGEEITGERAREIIARWDQGRPA